MFIIAENKTNLVGRLESLHPVCRFFQTLLARASGKVAMEFDMDWGMTRARFVNEMVTNAYISVKSDRRPKDRQGRRRGPKVRGDAGRAGLD
jgi:hypothetical protein